MTVTALQDKPLYRGAQMHNGTALRRATKDDAITLMEMFIDAQC
jgi:hypothetical protein